MQTKLNVDFCNYEAAKFAVLNWHYSKRMPTCKTVKFGVWENNRFIGAVIFGDGANNNLGKPYGLKSTEICELVRIALTTHKSPVTQIVSLARKKLKTFTPFLRLIVSFADSEQGHLGIIYQAGNWIYTGQTKPADEYIVNGKRFHGRAIRSTKPKGMPIKQYLKNQGSYRKIKGSVKYRYLYPLDKKMRKQVIQLSVPYLKQ